jgi:hypothetical protein
MFIATKQVALLFIAAFYWTPATLEEIADLEVAASRQNNPRTSTSTLGDPLLLSTLRYIAAQAAPNMTEPPEVLDAKRARPECSFAKQWSMATRFVDGTAQKEQSTKYFMQCPGEGRRLIHSSSDSAGGPRGEGGALSDDEVGGSGFGFGLQAELPDVDSFLRDFFGIDEEDHPFPGGRVPFPLPMPRPERRGGDVPRPLPSTGLDSGRGPGVNREPQLPPTTAQREQGKGVYI